MALRRMRSGSSLDGSYAPPDILLKGVHGERLSPPPGRRGKPELPGRWRAVMCRLRRGILQLHEERQVLQHRLSERGPPPRPKALCYVRGRISAQVCRVKELLYAVCAHCQPI